MAKAGKPDAAHGRYYSLFFFWGWSASLHTWIWLDTFSPKKDYLPLFSICLVLSSSSKYARYTWWIHRDLYVYIFWRYAHASTYVLALKPLVIFDKIRLFLCFLHSSFRKKYFLMSVWLDNNIVRAVFPWWHCDPSLQCQEALLLSLLQAEMYSQG